jgi:RNA polymerase sigma factor (sigma-70 family)
MFKINVSYCNLRQYRNTFHPAEERSISAQIALLRRDSNPFSATNMRYMPRNVQTRIVEDIALRFEISHPRFLQPSDFKNRLPGWDAPMIGMYEYYDSIKPKRGARTTVDFMLDSLEFERFDDLPIYERLKHIREFGNVYWKKIPKYIMRKLVERLAEEAGLEHPRMLTYDDFNLIEIPELGYTLRCLYDYYGRNYDGKRSIIDFLLDEIGIPKFDSLPWEKQLEIIKRLPSVSPTYSWDRIPGSTQLGLLETARGRTYNKNGMRCPHLRALGDNNLDNILPEIGRSLAGLLGSHRKEKPEGYGGSDFAYMLGQLGVPKFEELSFSQQCSCIKYREKVPFGALPKATIVGLLELVAQKRGFQHLRYLGKKDLTGVHLEEIGGNLRGLYDYFWRSKKAGDKREIIDIILDYCEVGQFKDMSVDLQVGWVKSVGAVRWRRVPDSLINRLLLPLVTKKNGNGRAKMLGYSSFSRANGNASATLLGLYQHLRRGGALSDARTCMAHFLGVGERVEHKRYGDFDRLDQAELSLLLFLAKQGDPYAMSNLIYFYEHDITKYARKVAAIFRGNVVMSELLQDGRLKFAKLVHNFDPGRGKSLANYISKPLSWHMYTKRKRRNGVIHKPAPFIEEMDQIGTVAGRLERELGRAPSEEELAERIGMSADELFGRRGLDVEEVSLSHPVFDGERELGDQIVDSSIIGPEQSYLEAEQMDNLAGGLDNAIENSGLNEMERDALRMYYLKEMGVVDVGAQMDVTHQRVSQLKNSAKKKIANGSRRQDLKNILSSLD